MIESRVVFKGRKDWHRKNVILDLITEGKTSKVVCQYLGQPEEIKRVMYEGDNKLFAENCFMTGFHHYLADEYLIVTDNKESKAQALHWFHKAVSSLYFRIMSSFGLTPEGVWKVDSYYMSDDRQVNEIGLRLFRADDSDSEEPIKEKKIRKRF